MYSNWAPGPSRDPSSRELGPGPLPVLGAVLGGRPYRRLRRKTKMIVITTRTMKGVTMMPRVGAVIPGKNTLPMCDGDQIATWAISVGPAGHALPPSRCPDH